MDDLLSGTDGPFDLTNVGLGMASNDAVSQEEVMVSVAMMSEDKQMEQYHHLPSVKVSLSSLANTHETRNEEAAMKMLQRKMSLQLGEPEMKRATAESLMFPTQTHFLDFMMTVSRAIGLDAILPGRNIRPWTFSLDLQRPYRELRANYGKLGFDPAGRLLYIGTIANVEQVFIAMRPVTHDPRHPLYDESSVEPLTTTLSDFSGSTQLTPERYQALAMFLIVQLAHSCSKGVWVFDEYGDSSADGFDEWKLKDVTDAL